MKKNMLILMFFLIGWRTNAQFIQQGPKLTCTGFSGPPSLGMAVSISADGNTAIIGGSGDNYSVGLGATGASWIFTRNGEVWTQVGNKLVGTGDEFANQGFSVSISADGKTAIVGGPYRNNGGGIGGDWIFTDSAGFWIQQGNRLVGTGAVNSPFSAQQGGSVAISGDGNTVIIGGSSDNNNIGAAWVFTRISGIWTQQGNKLVDSTAIGNILQGCSVSLSFDGNTALIGGSGDNNGIGATWVFTRSGGIWTQGSKLVGANFIGIGHQGSSVSISADGNTAIIGGPQDNNDTGAIWIFNNSGGVWAQQGNKLVGTGAIGNAAQGFSVSISYSGDTAIEGTNLDNNLIGSAWIFTRFGGVWTQLGNKLVGSGAFGAAEQGWPVSISEDGKTAILGGQNDSLSYGAAWIFKSSSTGIGDLNNKQEYLNLYPNPTSGTFTLSYNYQTPILNSQLKIYDVLGQQVYTQAIINPNQTTINVSQLSNGIYFWEMKTNHGIEGQGKIVIVGNR